MERNLRRIIASLVITAVALSMLLAFLLWPKGRDNDFVPLSCTTSDIVLNEGDEKTDFYILSHEDATITFYVDKEGIIDINEDRILALSAGSVEVVATVSLNDQSITATFKVTVIAEECHVKLSAVANCTIEDLVVSVSGDHAEFVFLLYDKNGELVGEPRVNMSSSGGAFQYAFGVLYVECEDFEIYLDFYEFNYTVTITVRKNIST